MKMEASMRVARIDRFGGPEVLHEETVCVPVPGEGELLVRVVAAGVNPVDYKIREGKYPAVKEDKLPYVPGRDVAGDVVECGASTYRFAKGEIIFAMPGIDRGAYAEYVIVKEDEAALKPRCIDVVAAGGVPLAALTAWQGLFRHGRLQKGQRTLIHGGSGGVGHFAVQFAKARGAYVAATASRRHLEFLHQLGVDLAIDYETQRFEDEIDNLDLVFDLIDGEARERSWSLIKKGGALVSTLTQPSQHAAAAHGVRATRYTVEESGSDLAEIAKLIDAGKVKPLVSKTFPFEQAAAAQQFLSVEHPAGKIVLTFD